MNFILEHIAEIGLDACREKISGPIMEAEARKHLNEFLEKQNRLNLNCTREEEIDFEGIANYIRCDLIEDVKLRFFGDSETRGMAHESIIKKAVYYAQSKTSLSRHRATEMVSMSLCILRKYYERKANRELSYFAGRIEDTLTDKMSSNHSQISKQLGEISRCMESSSLLSLDHNMELASSGQISKVGDNLSKVIKSIGTTHPLYPYYGYSMKNLGGEMVSTPLSKDAVIKYPPKFQITSNHVHVGSKDIFELSDKDVLDYSYRHQLPISLDVSTANKFLGDVLDPVQEEAKEMQGCKIIITPPQFPNAFPCSISINGDTFFDYSLMRTKEILEDGTLLVSNEEQDNRSFDIVFSINNLSKKSDFNIRPLTSSTVDHLKYRKFIKAAAMGGTVAIKILSLNALLGIGNINPFVPSVTLESEIEFLEKLIAIEHYFRVTFLLPSNITIEDHQMINYLHDIIHKGFFSGYWSNFNAVLKISEDFKKNINEADERPGVFGYTCVVDIELFSQSFSFSIRRELQVAKFKDLTRIKEKANILDIGDTITIRLVPDEVIGNNTYIDTFDTENNE